MSTDHLEEMVDEQALRHMLDQSDDFDFRRRIRARLRQLKKEASPAVESEKPTPKETTQFVRVQKTTLTTVEKPKITKQPENGHNEFLQRSTNLRSTSRTDESTRPSPSSKSGMQLEPVALRSSPRNTERLVKSGMELEPVTLRSSPRINEPRKTESSGAKIETVRLRKVAADQKATKDDPAKSRSNAAKQLSAKSAMARFKEMDLNSEAGQRYLEAGDRGARRRSPSPNSIRDQMLNWCRNRTFGYDDVQLDDFSASWNDGMAFCALVHSFYPEAFDYDTLDRKDKATNFQLAFDTAEKLAGVVPLLDVEDMVRMPNPDWKCVFTYVNCFANRMSEIRKEKKKAAELKEKENELQKDQQNDQQKDKQNDQEKEQKEEEEEGEEEEEEEEAGSD